MNQNGTLERIEMTNGTEGGVVHLLRLTRTQCHAWVAFVALRREDGTIDITAVPGADDESSEWTLDTLQGIVRQTLEDPLIGEGRAVIRVSEVFRRYWPGERQYTRMAVAPLNDVAEPGRPWGLLCALDPVDGQFSEAQLDMLGRLAVRFINHLRARRQFVSDTEASDALLSRALGEQAVPERPRSAIPAPGPTGATVSAGEPLPDEGIVRIERAATWLARQGQPSEAEPFGTPSASGTPAAERRLADEVVPEPLTSHEPSSGEVEVVFGEAFRVEEAPFDEAEEPVAFEPAVEPSAGPMPEAEPAVRVQTTAPAGWTPEPAGWTPEPAVEAVEPVEPAEPVATPSAPAVEHAEATVAEGPVEAAAPPAPAAPAVERQEAPEGALGATVRRVRLSELIEQLEGTIERLRSAKRNGALFLVELPVSNGSPAGDSLTSAAARLSEATRFNDVVLAVGSDMVAVVMELGPRAARLEAIRERLLAASAGTEIAATDLRASTVGLEPEAGQSAEGLVLQAVRQLGVR